MMQNIRFDVVLSPAVNVCKIYLSLQKNPQTNKHTEKTWAKLFKMEWIKVTYAT